MKNKGKGSIPLSKPVFFQKNAKKNNYSHGLRILHQNIGGVLNKLDNLEFTLQEFEKNNQIIDILCLSETFIRKGSEHNVKLHDFKLVSSFCREKSRGGTAILVRKTIDVKPIKFVSELASDFYFKSCGIEIIGIDLIIITIYRIPKQTTSHVGVFIHKIDNLLKKLTLIYKKKKIVLCGD